MDSTTIANALLQFPDTRKKFRGVFAADQLPARITRRPRLIIANTAPSSDSGKHWVAMYITTTGISEFYDPLGEKPPEGSFESFLITHGPLYLYNAKRLQNFGTNTCGHHCLFYAAHRCLGWSMQDIVNLFQNRSLAENESLVTDFARHVWKL